MTTATTTKINSKEFYYRNMCVCMLITENIYKLYQNHLTFNYILDYPVN